MSKFIKQSILQPGNYTISVKGYTHLGSAYEESGFDGSSEVYAKDILYSDFLFDVDDKSCLTLKNNETNEEEIIFIARDGQSCILYSEEAEAKDDYEEENTEEDDDWDNDDYEENRIYFDDGTSYPIIIESSAESFCADTDQFFFEEYCPEGIIEKSFEITEPLDLSQTDFYFFKNHITNHVIVQFDFPTIGKLTNISSKGNVIKCIFFIEEQQVSDISKIKTYLNGIDAPDTDALFTELFDGFIIQDNVITEYKGYSDKILIPERVTEIADNVFIFPVESISMPNKNIKVGKNFPWDKVL